jgi:glycosyltransferase involved in cell wall biosynthesis
MVAAEGSLSSLPVVVSDTGGLPEVVQDGVTGIVVPKDEPQALSQALQKLLSNPALAKEMGKAGRERVRKKFLLEKTVDDYENLYAEIKKARS